MSQQNQHDEITPAQQAAALKIFGNETNVAKAADAALTYINAREDRSAENRRSAATAIRAARQSLPPSGRKYLRDRVFSVMAHTGGKAR